MHVISCDGISPTVDCELGQFIYLNSVAGDSSFLQSVTLKKIPLPA
jgi:hypothetical protein